MGEPTRPEWEKPNRSARQTIQPGRREFQEFIPHLGWRRSLLEQPPLEITDESIGYLRGDIEERNAPSFTSTVVPGGLGLSINPVDYRFALVAQHFGTRSTWSAVDQRPLILLGTSNNGREVQFPRQLTNRAPSDVAILMTPSEIACHFLGIPERAQRYWVESPI